MHATGTNRPRWLGTLRLPRLASLLVLALCYTTCRADWCTEFPPGEVLLDCESPDPWIVEQEHPNCYAEKRSGPGHVNQAVCLDYDFLIPGTDPAQGGFWAQLRYDFPEPRDFSNCDMLRFRFRGASFRGMAGKNHLQVWLHDADDDRVGLQITQVTDVPAWVYASLPYSVPSRSIAASVLVRPFGWQWGDGTFDITQVKKIFFAVSRLTVLNDDDPSNDNQDPRLLLPGTQSGTLAIDDIVLVDSVGRTDRPALDGAPGSATHADRAAGWIASQQKPLSGLLQSWKEEPSPKAHIYDQALGLIVFIRKGWLTEASALVNGLIAIQNPDDPATPTDNEDGSWYKWYDPLNTSTNAGILWEGDVAWAAYALGLHWHRTGDAPALASAQRACAWLVRQIGKRPDGSVHDGIEANVDTWFAFDIVGGFDSYKNGVRTWLLTKGWDDARRRFCRGPNDVDPGNALDVHTWGSEFLRRIGQDTRAIQTMQFACGTLPCTSFDGTDHGFDGEGPFSVWWEGVGQWVAAHGWNSDAYLAVLNLQQEPHPDNGVPGSPDDYGGAYTWRSTWHGVAPAAWLYFANTCPVFSQGFIKGHVYQSDGTTPVTGGTVWAYQNGSTASTGVIRSDGSYCLAGLDAGSYSLACQATGYPLFVRTGAVAVERAKDTIVDLTLTDPSIEPQSGPALTRGVIRGAGFGANAGFVRYVRGAGAAIYWEVLNWSDTQISFRVPAGTPSSQGLVRARRADATETGPMPFQVTRPVTLCVDGNNTTSIENGTDQYPFSTAQEAIAAAANSGTLMVARGTYSQSLTIAGKLVTIKGGCIGGAYPGVGDFAEATRGKDPSTNGATLDGGGAPYQAACQDPSARGSTLTGFAIRNGGAIFRGGVVLKRVIAQSH